jgi:poly(3-hydroxyoctanoate) depolymerase
VTGQEGLYGTQYVAVSGSRVRVRIEGAGSPLLLIMGIGGNLDMWQPLLERLPGRQLVMFDFPGTGASTQPWIPPTMAHSAGSAETRHWWMPRSLGA